MRGRFTLRARPFTAASHLTPEILVLIATMIKAKRQTAQSEYQNYPANDRNDTPA